MAIPEQPQPPVTVSGKVDIVGVFASEFGAMRTAISEQLIAGTLEIDGKTYVGPDKFFVPLDAIAGRALAILGPERHWRMSFRG